MCCCKLHFLQKIYYLYNIHKNIILHLPMKFLHFFILFYLHIFINAIKLNNNKINCNHLHNNHIPKPNTLPIQPKKLFSKGFYSNMKFSGKDERYSENEVVETNKLYENIQNKKILDVLQDNTISIYNKLEMLRDDSIKPCNLHAGGLMEDFEFDIET